jgi:hypothetical protein
MKNLRWLSSERKLRAYRNQQVTGETLVTRISLFTGGFDTSREERRDYSTTENIWKKIIL